MLSRRSREAGDGIAAMTGDLATGEGLEAAVDGVAAIVHCASSNKGDAGAARNLVRAASSLAASSRAGAPHLVYISIVGIDRVPAHARHRARGLVRIRTVLVANRPACARTGPGCPVQVSDSRQVWPTRSCPKL